MNSLEPGRAAYWSLFEDQYFEAAFGSTFDELEGYELSAIGGVIRKNLQASVSQSVQKAFRAKGAGAIGVCVLAQRGLHGWQEHAIQSIPTVETTEVGYNHLVAIGIESKRLSGLWPSGRDEIRDPLDAAKSRIASQIVGPILQDALESSVGRNGVDSLNNWEYRNVDLVGHLDEGTQGSVRERIKARLAVLLEPLVARDVSQLLKLGTGREAVSAGAQWSRRYRELYSRNWHQPCVKAGWGQFLGRRGNDLADAMGTLEAEISKAEKTLQLDLLQSATLIEADGATEVGRRVNDLVAFQRREILIGEAAERAVETLVVAGLVHWVSDRALSHDDPNRLFAGLTRWGRNEVIALAVDEFTMLNIQERNAITQLLKSMFDNPLEPEEWVAAEIERRYIEQLGARDADAANVARVTSFFLDLVGREEKLRR